MDEYFELLLSQIRCKKARPYIKDEIKDHIECQVEDYIATGMSYEDAQKKAVVDMGDPVEVGISLDRIHRPQIAWPIVVLISMISLIGVLIHFLISREINASIETGSIHPQTIYSNLNYYSGVLFGLLAMIIVYFIDYSVIAKYARLIGAAMIGIGLLGSIWGYSINGIGYIGINNFRIMSTSFLMLYVPIYGAILYKYRNTSWKGILYSILWLVIPVIEALRTINVYLAVVLFVSLMVLLMIAVADGCFLVPKKGTLIAMFSFLMISPLLSLAMLYFRDSLLADYQKARIRAFIHPSYREGVGYVAYNLRDQITSSVLIGNNGKEILGAGENYTSDFIFTYITGTYGILAGVLVCAVMALLIISIFVMASKQKNRVGMIMGCGCGILFLINTCVNVLENVGYFPLTLTFMPFFSSGRSNLMISYLLVGIVLSICRYGNVYPRHFKFGQNIRV